MNKPSISKTSRYKQGIYVPTNPDKYIGSGEIRYRSSWEKRMMVWLDKNKSVLYWNSEDLKIQYISPLDNKVHRYFVDFIAKMVLRDGSIKTYAIEVKPAAQCIVPKSGNKKRMISETMTYVVNQAKWNAAKEYCSKHNIEFIVITENDLCI